MKELRKLKIRLEKKLERIKSKQINFYTDETKILFKERKKGEVIAIKDVIDMIDDKINNS